MRQVSIEGIVRGSLGYGKAYANGDVVVGLLSQYHCIEEKVHVLSPDGIQDEFGLPKKHYKDWINAFRAITDRSGTITGFDVFYSWNPGCHWLHAQGRVSATGEFIDYREVEEEDWEKKVNAINGKESRFLRLHERLTGRKAERFYCLTGLSQGESGSRRPSWSWQDPRWKVAAINELVSTGDRQVAFVASEVARAGIYQEAMIGPEPYFFLYDKDAKQLLHQMRIEVDTSDGRYPTLMSNGAHHVILDRNYATHIDLTGEPQVHRIEHRGWQTRQSGGKVITNTNLWLDSCTTCYEL